ncbi:MAG: MBL fold metallo-hydrolase [Anaerolineaceae bacterium]|nr:MBL fold metallo-hydrolase [Anaerolineaceae bacterium]
MKIADGVDVLEITSTRMGPASVINPTLIWDSSAVILTDTGFPGQLEDIRAAMLQAGVPFSKLSKIILTHQDIDHIGGLPELLKESNHKIEVLAHQGDKPFIEGEQPLLKMKNIEQRLAGLPEDQRKQAAALFGGPIKNKLDRTLEDGEKLPYCGGITVIYTPGHTPGHICLYLQRSKTLVAGDAMVVGEGHLLGPRPNATPDMDTAIKSLQKLTQYNIETVICYHGGVYRGQANQRINELAQGAA